MARLNEPPAPVDSFEILRRKFLRQNRDIARVNSNQSLRIRGLENECARLLSENLDLRGQVLRLEKELDDNRSQRVAEHALQIKQKMEAQLVELGALLAGFGLEPPPKRQSPAAPRRANRPARLSLATDSLSPQQQRRPPALSPQEAESLAAQEGRLPPIFEHKTFPRQTLSCDEILALQTNDVETAESPELGPPPVSRMLRDDLRKPATHPSRSTSEAAAQGQLSSEATNRPAALPVKEEPPAEDPTEEAAAVARRPTSANTSAKNKPASEEKGTQRAQGADAKPAESAPAPTASAPVLPPTTAPAALVTPGSATAGAKRKFAVSDENAVIRGMKATGGNSKTPATAKGQADNGLPIRELKNPRSIRSLVNSRKDGVEGSSGETKTAAGGRKPLAAKSTNEDISSPRKQAQGDMGKAKGGNGANAADKTAALGGSRMRSRMKTPLAVDPPQNALPPLTATVDVTDDDKNSNPITPVAPEEHEPAPLDLEEPAPCPSTPTPPKAPDPTALAASPQSAAARGGGRDTPPPADISFQGEMSRPSRRARASVSYVEPNLRDKMRRPTKELFDAVSGEGKYVRQHLQTHSSDTTTSQSNDRPAAAGAVSVKSETASLPTEHEPRKEEPDVPRPQHAPSDKRRQRTSSVGARESEQKQGSGVVATAAAAAAAAAAAVEAAAAAAATGDDPYEFTVSSSPQTQETDDEESEGKAKGAGGSSSTRRSSSGHARTASNSKTTARRSSTSTTASRDDGSTTAADRHTRPSAARKRASMVALKRGSSLLDDDEDDPADSSYEPPAAESAEAQAVESRSMSTRDRISRRRSMML